MLKLLDLEKLKDEFAKQEYSDPIRFDVDEFQNWISDFCKLKPWKILIYGNSFTGNYEYCVCIDNNLILSALKNFESVLETEKILNEIKTFFGCEFEIKNMQFIDEAMLW